MSFARRAGLNNDGGVHPAAGRETGLEARGEANMTTSDFTTSFTVDQTPLEVFDAVNDVRSWWSGEIDGETDKLGAEFTYRYKDVHRSSQKITEFVPGKKVVWQVTDAELNFVKDEDERNGTRIEFDIAEEDGKTKLIFTHVGLIPKFECYGGCSGAWGFYINDSLRGLIAEGEGRPNK